jgi:Fic family protein
MDATAFDSEGSPGDLVNADGRLAFDPDPLPPDLDATHDLLDANGQAMYALGRLADLERTIDTPRIILSLFIHREAASSSRVEGTRVTLSDIYRHDLGEEVGQSSHDRADIAEAANYVEAISDGITALEAGEVFDEALIQRLHQQLLGGVRGESKQPGEYRDRLVGVGTSDGTGAPSFIPTPASNVPFQMRLLVQYLQQGGQYAPLIDIALVHYQFETIHPFLDGNGRLGRLLIVLLLYEWELLPGPYLYLSAYFNANRDEYVDTLLAVSQRGVWEEWLLFFLDALRTQAEAAYDAARDLLTLRDRYRDQYRDAGPVLRELVEYLFERPYLTVQIAADGLDRTEAAVNEAMNRLETDGVVVETTGKQRYRRFQAHDVLDIVEPY